MPHHTSTHVHPLLNSSELEDYVALCILALSITLGSFIVDSVRSAGYEMFVLVFSSCLEIINVAVKLCDEQSTHKIGLTHVCLVNICFEWECYCLVLSLK